MRAHYRKRDTPTFILLMNAGAGTVAAVLAALIVHRVSTWHDDWRPPVD
jgi:hypothetical protein